MTVVMVVAEKNLAIDPHYIGFAIQSNYSSFFMLLLLLLPLVLLLLYLIG